mgnify:CR=1 FL=1
MSESTNINQNDNVSAFDSILNKYSNLLIEVEKLRKENENIKSRLAAKGDEDLGDKTPDNLSAKIYPTLNEIKKEISLVNQLISKSNKNEKEPPKTPRKRKKKSSKKSLFKKFTSSIGLAQN